MTVQGTPDLDQAKAEEFVGKVLGDASGLTATLLAAIGDRQPPLVGVLPGEGELPVCEAVEVVLLVVDEIIGRPALLPQTRP